MFVVDLHKYSTALITTVYDDSLRSQDDRLTFIVLWP